MVSACLLLIYIKVWYSEISYNFDETGFQINVASTIKFVTGSYHTTSCVRALQPGN